MARILIVYRSNDLQATVTAKRLQNDLSKTFRVADVTLNFVGERNPNDILLVIINQAWLEAQEIKDHLRLPTPDDYFNIRMRLIIALQAKAIIIPILVNDTPAPSPDQLASSLRDLTNLPALRLYEDSRWDSDLAKLVTEVSQYQIRISEDDEYLLDDVLRQPTQAEPPKPILPPAMPAPAAPPGRLDDNFGGELAAPEPPVGAQHAAPLPPPPPAMPVPTAPPQAAPPKPERKRAEAEEKSTDLRFGQRSQSPAPSDSESMKETSKPPGISRGMPAPASSPTQTGASIWPLSPAEYLQQLQNPTFSAYYPAAIQPAQPYTLLAYVHIAIAEGLVAQDAGQYRALMGGTQSSSSAPSRVEVTAGERITFVPRIEGLTFTPAEQTIQWDYQHDFIKAAFLFTAPAHLTQPLTGVIQVYKGVFIAGELPITMALQTTPSEVNPPHKASYHAFDPVFASYSHRDTPVMEFFRQQRARLGQKLWVDIYDLRSGEHWNARLLEMIEQSAAVQLFWSDHSAQSQYCRQEWQYALQVGMERPRFIQPVWWESPMPTPPDELAHLHFQKIDLPLQTRAQLWGKRVKGWLGRGGT